MFAARRLLKVVKHQSCAVHRHSNTYNKWWWPRERIQTVKKSPVDGKIATGPYIYFISIGLSMDMTERRLCAWNADFRPNLSDAASATWKMVHCHPSLNRVPRRLLADSIAPATKRPPVYNHRSDCMDLPLSAMQMEELPPTIIIADWFHASDLVADVINVGSVILLL